MKLKAEHVAWYQCEIAKFVLSHLETPVATFNIDRKLDPYFKESWCKRNHPAILARYEPQAEPSTQMKDVTLSTDPTSSDAGICIQVFSDIPREDNQLLKTVWSQTTVEFPGLPSK